MKLVTQFLVVASLSFGVAMLAEPAYATAVQDSEIREIPIQRIDSGEEMKVEEYEIEVDGAEVSDARREKLKQRLERMRERIENKVGRDLDLSLDSLSRDVAALAAEGDRPIVIDDNLDQLVEYALAKHGQEADERFYTVALIPIISIISVFSMPVLIVGLVMYFRHRRRQLVAESLANVVAKAPSVSSETLEKIQSLIEGEAPQTASVSDVKDLRRGAFLSVVGGVCIISQLLQGDVEGTWFGLLLLGLGLVYLYLYKNRPSQSSID